MKADSIQIDAGQKRILINDDPKRVLKFNPLDILFAEKFYALLGDFHEKDKEFRQRMLELENSEDKDEFGLPANLPDSFSLMHEMSQYMHEQIDELFGVGTSEMVFEGVDNLEMIQQFFEGLIPFIQKARVKKVEKYTKPRQK